MKLRKMLTRQRYWLVAGLLLVFSHCIKKTTSNEIFKDTFNRDDSNTTLGENWTLYKPNGYYMSISNQKAKPIAGNATVVGSLPVALYTQKIKDAFKVSAKFSISGGYYNSMGFLIARSAAADLPSDSYLCGYYYSLGTTSPKKYYFALQKLSSGAVTTLGEAPMHNLVSGITDTISFTLDGTSLKCEMAGNSTISISVVDSSYTTGYTGIIGGGGELDGGGGQTNNLYFDDFLVEKL